MKQINEPSQPVQSGWNFIEELQRPEPWVFNWSRTVCHACETNLSGGIRLFYNFPDPSGLLDTAYEGMEHFFDECGIKQNGSYKIITLCGDTGENDSFRIQIEPATCKIIAENTEGIRRGIFYLEDLLLGADGPFLKIGEINREPWIKNRISRCFFGPIKRPPLNRDELMDDVDYYPEEYLNRLAHEGINGLWLTIKFSDLCKTPITPEYGKDAERRLAKLRRTVDKCLRYGIKTYIFCIEPATWSADSTVLARHPKLGGACGQDGSIFFCPFSDTAQNYLYEAVNGIFKSVPSLGGLINISQGERATTCLSSVPATENRTVDCPVCSQKKHWEILHSSLSAMEKGMHDAAPDAQLISWLYIPYTNEFADWVFEIPKHIPKNVTLQFNFESGGTEEQNGKLRTGGDYWLSYVGPSDRFKRIAESAKIGGIAMSAKIQVGCSHEVASVPFVPVPAQLFRKYHEMKKLGVSNVMQCWYFGNYPGIMNKAAGMLAFEDFEAGEKDFLKKLALPEWGRHANAVVSAWMLFTDGYSNYPFSNMFQYYGPMHDGVVWPLYLYPEYKTLSPTWLLQFGTSGDLIGECLDAHTIEEAESLCRTLSEKWNQGVEILKAICKDFENNPARLKDIGVAEALGIQFESGYNILRFYALRERLFRVKSSTQQDSILDEMESIVRSEINRSKRLIELCGSDSRLGFHSEAEGYKYFPKKLQWRIDSLETLLAEDFTEARKSLNAGSLKLPQLANVKKYACGSGKFEQCETFRWKASCSTTALIFDVECDNKGTPDQIFLTLLNTTTNSPIIIDVNRTSGLVSDSTIGSIASVSDSATGWKNRINVPFSVFKSKPENILSLSIIRYAGIDGKVKTYAWEGTSFDKYRLGMGFYNSMGNLILSEDKS